MATIVMESAKVIEAAQQVIDRIMAKRKQRDEAAIAKRMQPQKFLWFTTKALTREEAIAKLDKEAENTFLGEWRSQYAWGDLAKAKALLKLAQHGDPVTLNEDDIEVLF